MNRDTAVARVQETLGFRSDLETVIQNRLQDAQIDLELSHLCHGFWKQRFPVTLQ